MLLELTDSGDDRDAGEFTIPGSSPPVQLRRLHRDPVSGASVSLVRFPAGWSRPGSGHYPAAEEFVVIEGDLEVRRAFRAGDYAYLPPGVDRRDSKSERGALVLAWFSGPPVWSEVPGGPDDQVVVVPGVIDTRGLLRGRSERVAGTFEVCDRSATAGPGGADVLALGERTWHWLSQGQSHEAVSGPLLVRQWA